MRNTLTRESQLGDGFNCAIAHYRPCHSVSKCNAFQCFRLTSLSGHIGGYPRFPHFDHLQGFRLGAENLSRLDHSLIMYVLKTSPRQRLRRLFSGDDRRALEEEGVIPPESSARDRFCVTGREGLQDYFHVASATTGVTSAAAIRLVWAEYAHVMFEFLIQRRR